MAMIRNQPRSGGRGKSSGLGWGWLLAGMVVIIASGALWWLLGAPRGERAVPGSIEIGSSVSPGEDLSIWFASPQEDALVVEKHRVPPHPTPVERAKASLQALISGPTSGALRTVSAEVKIRELFIDERGTAYIDFSEALSRDHPGGVWSEMLTLRSILQTLVANVPEVKRVHILIEGRVVETLAGHLDIRRPFDASWVVNQP
jgi:spore germination protein GerM